VSLLQLCSISIYHFRIVTELAFLSTVTHLLTVVALRNYFVYNRWTNVIRVLVMILNLALLGYTTWFEYALDTMDNSIDGLKLACYLGPRPLPSNSVSVFRWVILLLVAVVAHFSVFWAMYIDNQGRNSGKGGWFKFLGTMLRDYIVTPAYTIYGLVVGSKVLRKTQAFGSPTVNVIGSEREWGFGQVLAVVLLALVILPGWEAFFESVGPLPSLGYADLYSQMRQYRDLFKESELSLPM
jgi:hypothetical protein